MGSGIPLTDGDRWDWLITLRKEALKELQTCNAIIVTCSALRRKYRDVIRVAGYERPTVQVHFIYLNATEEYLQERVKSRVGHYMKESLVRSQMETLEEPGQDEFDVSSVDVQNDRHAVRKDALARVQDVALVITTT